MTTPSWVPRCPNHGSVLEGMPFPLPQKGTGICPVSGAPFDFEAEVDETRTIVDKFGNKTTAKSSWTVSGNEQ